MIIFGTYVYILPLKIKRKPFIIIHLLKKHIKINALYNAEIIALYNEV